MRAALDPSRAPAPPSTPSQPTASPLPAFVTARLGVRAFNTAANSSAAVAVRGRPGPAPRNAPASSMPCLAAVERTESFRAVIHCLCTRCAPGHDSSASCFLIALESGSTLRAAGKGMLATCAQGPCTLTLAVPAWSGFTVGGAGDEGDGGLPSASAPSAARQAPGPDGGLSTVTVPLDATLRPAAYNSASALLSVTAADQVRVSTFLPRWGPARDLVLCRVRQLPSALPSESEAVPMQACCAHICPRLSSSTAAPASRPSPRRSAPPLRAAACAALQGRWLLAGDHAHRCLA